MIKWKKYDPKNPPELKPLYLFRSESGKIHVGFYSQATNEWFNFNDEWEAKELVTHYAEVNLPGEVDQ